MKKMNRREFLTLSGAAVVALSLAGCGGGSSAPAAPATAKDAKVLEALNLYRKEKKLGTFEMDDRLNEVTEGVVNCALGKTEYDEMLQTVMAKLYPMATAPDSPYEDFGIPFGVLGKGKPTMPYDEDINVMKDALLALEPADTADNIGKPGVNLISIKVFTASDGKVYWVAVVAKGKKTA